MNVLLGGVLLLTSGGVAAPSSVDFRGYGFSKSGSFAHGSAIELESEEGWENLSFHIVNLDDDSRVFKASVDVRIGDRTSADALAFLEQARAAIAKNGIRMDPGLRFSHFPLREDGDSYDVRVEANHDEPTRPGKLVLRSAVKGTKEIGEGPTASDRCSDDWNTSYLRSPYEPRIVVHLSNTCLGFEAEPYTESATYGARLDRGFTPWPAWSSKMGFSKDGRHLGIASTRSDIGEYAFQVVRLEDDASVFLLSLFWEDSPPKPEYQTRVEDAKKRFGIRMNAPAVEERFPLETKDDSFQVTVETADAKGDAVVLVSKRQGRKKIGVWPHGRRHEAPLSFTLLRTPDPKRIVVVVSQRFADGTCDAGSDCVHRAIYGARLDTGFEPERASP